MRIIQLLFCLLCIGLHHCTATDGRKYGYIDGDDYTILGVTHHGPSFLDENVRCYAVFEASSTLILVVKMVKNDLLDNGCLSMVSMKALSGEWPVGENTYDLKNNVTEVIIENGVTTIEDEEFINFVALKKVAIQSSNLIDIGERAFSGCKSLKSIICLSPNPPQIKSDAFDGLTEKFCLYVPERRDMAYRDYYNRYYAKWQKTFDILPLSQVER